MTGRLEGKVVFVTGGARGQGRSHVLRLAGEGAAVVAFDVCMPIATLTYPPTIPEDLDETVRLVRDADGKAIGYMGDVRSFFELKAAVQLMIDTYGPPDVVVANAGVVSAGLAVDLTEEAWDVVVGTNLTGVWLTVKATVPAMMTAGRGGLVIIISSVAGLKGSAGLAHYVAAKHGGVGLMRTLANELGRYSIRVNTVHPTGVNTPMGGDQQLAKVIGGDQYLTRAYVDANAMPVEMVQPEDVSDAAVWLASDESKFTTGATLPVDAGALIR